MGGDGGVIASNRRYMRGAGTADHTGDAGRSSDKISYSHDEAMTTCHLTHKPLSLSSSSSTVVACPYGHMYNKETAVEALLDRKKQHHDGSVALSGQEVLGLGPQVRRLGDLMPVRFHLENGKITCPITSKALTGSSVAAILLVPGKEGVPNVVCESALPKEKQQSASNEASKKTSSNNQHFHLSISEIEQEYGPIKKRVRLAPPPSLLESTIVEQVRLEQEREEEERKAWKKQKKDKKSKKSSKKEKSSDNTSSSDLVESKKRKRDDNIKNNIASTKHGVKKSLSLENAVQSRVDTAIQKNGVLSSLFTTNDRKVSEKEKKDNLFAR
mmetsp:Transcript_24583/g.58315  ORF Transcript_24583/g.58315 Transcript_24583/m.58315 type:complete len:328 (+) Transcript_24583:122-1105(+)